MHNMGLAENQANQNYRRVGENQAKVNYRRVGENQATKDHVGLGEGKANKNYWGWSDNGKCELMRGRRKESVTSGFPHTDRHARHEKREREQRVQWRLDSDADDEK